MRLSCYQGGSAPATVVVLYGSCLSLCHEVLQQQHGKRKKGATPPRYGTTRLSRDMKKEGAERVKPRQLQKWGTDGNILKRDRDNPSVVKREARLPGRKEKGRGAGKGRQQEAERPRPLTPVIIRTWVQDVLLHFGQRPLAGGKRGRSPPTSRFGKERGAVLDEVGFKPPVPGGGLTPRP